MEGGGTAHEDELKVTTWNSYTSLPSTGLTCEKHSRLACMWAPDVHKS